MATSHVATNFTRTSAHILYVMWASNSLSPAAVLQFVEPDYATVEGMGFRRPLVQLLTNIATDLTVAAVPVDYTSLNDSQSPILDVIPSVANYDPRRPINATSK